MSDLPYNSGYTDSPELGRDKGSNRKHIEFYCQECSHYTYCWLNMNLEGNHIMNCPNCGHKHYRVVKGGIITSDRHNDSMPELHEIVAMKSACVPSTKRRTFGDIARIRELEATGDHK